ncbi:MULTISPECIES: hypothetical protein [Actinosynnema]|uniref:hypothetical protein n=1 Tax=Actinosynnema TaxID=40566 RepID=UPI0020A544E2|nr:hypothetical protein [Actinosynnema pretiosum]MCP2095119.1 hypothetical protein [Actinosynnema pretiosum]
MTTPDPHGTPGQPPQGYPQAGYPQAGVPQGYPQQGYPQQGYPQAGTPPQGYPSFPAANPMSEGEPTPRPKSVDLSFLLWMVSAVLSVLTLIVTNLNIEATVAETAARLTEAGLPVDPAEIDTSVSVVSVVISLAINAIWVAVAFVMRNGANWARIVLTVLGALSLVFSSLFSLLSLPVLFSIGALGVVEALLSIVGIPVMLAAIVYMFTGGAGRYFATR